MSGAVGFVYEQLVSRRAQLVLLVTRGLVLALTGLATWILGGDAEEIPGIVEPAAAAIAAFVVGLTILILDIKFVRPKAKIETENRRAIKALKDNPPGSSPPP